MEPLPSVTSTTTPPLPQQYQQSGFLVPASKMSLDLACVSNCSFSALIDRKGQVVWSCFPRFDGDPIFCSLLKRSSHYSNDIGFFDIHMPGMNKTEQKYIKNSGVLSTKLWSNNNCLEIIDFAPRFDAHDRDYRPNMLIRVVKPIKGRPRAQIRLRPTFGYGWGTPEKTRGSNHIRYLLSNMTVRLTTNAPISYVVDEVLFEIEEPLYLVLMPDDSLKAPLSEMSESYLQKTLSFWNNWTRGLTIPFEWQEQVLRAAVTLKMSHFEETGAFVAAMTTSIPTKPHGTNYDYRYCWLSDSLAIIMSLSELGATATMESYLTFLSNIVADFTEQEDTTGMLSSSTGGMYNTSEKRLQPVYGISLENRLYERDMHRLSGYRGQGPVKLGTSDAESVQNGVYGFIILALTQTFYDKRLKVEGDIYLYERLEVLGEAAKRVYNQPDQWEGSTGVHTWSAVMCWAACDRLARIAQRLKLEDRHLYWKESAAAMHAEILANSWNSAANCLVSLWGSEMVKPTLLQLPLVGFMPASDKRYVATVEAVEKTCLKNGRIIMDVKDGNISKNHHTFYYIRALGLLGRKEEARQLFESMLKSMNHLGMMSETIQVDSSNELWGNFPQNNAMVGLINCAINLSAPWSTLHTAY